MQNHSHVPDGYEPTPTPTHTPWVTEAPNERTGLGQAALCPAIPLPPSPATPQPTGLTKLVDTDSSFIHVCRFLRARSTSFWHRMISLMSDSKADCGVGWGGQIQGWARVSGLARA